jgi:2Fe-2S ferredoxin
MVVTESRAGASMKLHVQHGAAVMDACDAAGAPIQFCCRSASCGTCRVEVLRGGDQLVPAGPDELLMLAVFDADPARVRLVCQLRVRNEDHVDEVDARAQAHECTTIHVRALED